MCLCVGSLYPYTSCFSHCSVKISYQNSVCFPHSTEDMLSIMAVQTCCPSQHCRHPVHHSSVDILSITAVWTC